MVFAAHNTSGGLVLLAELSTEQVTDAYHARFEADDPDFPDLLRLRTELSRVRSQGFAVNHGRSERGAVAVGVPIRGADGTAVAGLAVSIPSVRYDRKRLLSLVATLHLAAHAIEAELTR